MVVFTINFLGIVSLYKLGCILHEIGINVTRPSYFVAVPSYFEALWYPHLYFNRKSNI